MKKAEKIGIIAALCGIILLFLIASTDFVLEENRKEVYTIAFVTDGSADDRFQSLRKGMEKAAKKWNVDLVVDAPYLSGNAAEQEAAIEEAVENGAQAVITVPADQVQMEKFLDQSKLQVPVITLEKELHSEKNLEPIFVTVKSQQKSWRELYWKKRKTQALLFMHQMSRQKRLQIVWIY